MSTKPGALHFAVANRAVVGLGEAVAAGGLQLPIGCACWLNVHSKDARAHGEDEQRLHMLAAWRQAPLYGEREWTALARCEALTLLPQTGADDVCERPRRREVPQPGRRLRPRPNHRRCRTMNRDRGAGV